MKTALLRMRGRTFWLTMAGVILGFVGPFGCSGPVTAPIHIEPESVDQEAKLERELRFRMAYDQQQRVVRVAFPMLTGAVDLCKDSAHYVTGMNFLNRRSFERSSSAIAVLGLTDEVKVTGVVPGSPADKAGVRVDDLVVAIGGSAVSTGAGATEALQTKLQELVRDGGAFKITLSRDGVLRDAVVLPVKACAFSVAAIDGDVVNAFADGTTITITVGMLRFVQDDTELALVISHELAHNLLKHLAAKSANEVSGLLAKIGFVAAAVASTAKGGSATLGRGQSLSRASFSAEFEAEADYVGLYMMARAGMEIDRAPQFWRGMGAAYPASNKAAFGASHPSDAYRMLALEATVEQIKRKIAEGFPIVPDTRESSSIASELNGAPLLRIEPGESIVVLQSPQFLVDWDHQRRAAKLDVRECVSSALRRKYPDLRVIPQSEFVKLAFPDLPPEAAPISPDSLKLLIGHEVLRRRITPLDVRFFVYASTSTETRMLSDSFGCFTGFGTCVISASWEKESNYALSIIDAKKGGEVSSKGSLAGRGWYFTIMPLIIGSTGATETQACDKLGQDVLARLTSGAGQSQ